MGAKLRYIYGFTIIELLIVVAIIGILAGVTAVVYNGVQANARDTSVLSDLDTMDGLQTSYSLKNSGNAKPYYSGDGPDSELGFAPSGNNVIDVVTSGEDYCIRGYNPAGTKKSIYDAFTKGTTPDICTVLLPSTAAGGAEGGLVGWWKFNGNANDSSGNSNDGTVNGATLTTDKSGNSNRAYSLNGTSDYISVANEINLSGWSFSVSVWFKTGTQGDRKIVSTNVHTPLQIFSYGQLRACILQCGAGGPNVADNVWHNAVSVGDESSARVYLDGVETPIISQAPLLSTLGTSVRFGRTDVGGGGMYYSGDLDDIRIYNFPLSVAHIESIYEAGPQ